MQRFGAMAASSAGAIADPLAALDDEGGVGGRPCPPPDHHLAAGSPCVDVGRAAGMGQGVPLTPSEQYVYNLGRIARPVHGAAMDAGAFER